MNTFQGDVVAAVDRYQDIPAGVRAALKKRVAARKYDEIATIKRDEILGAHRYTDLRDMHFGKGQICGSVTRTKWQPGAQERGLVYCEEGHCLIVPTVCRNVSRVTRVPMQKAQADEPTGAGAGDPSSPMTASAAAVPPGTGELQFEAPSAGATPSFVSGLSGSSPVAPGSSDSGLASGSADGGTPFTSFGSPFAGPPAVFASGSPVVPVAVVPATPTTPVSADPGVPGVPGVPGTPATPVSPTTPSVPGTPTTPSTPTTPTTPALPTDPAFPGTPGGPVVPGITPTVPGTSPLDPGLPGVPSVPPSVTTPIPEPSTWAMMGLGLGLIALMGRRRMRREG